VIAPDSHGNREAREGCDRCYCGSKYWEHDKCVDCGTEISECLRDPEWVAANRSAS
jgi:ribosomal protein L37E